MRLMSGTSHDRMIAEEAAFWSEVARGASHETQPDWKVLRTRLANAVTDAWGVDALMRRIQPALKTWNSVVGQAS
jgi:hypothetical protein